MLTASLVADPALAVVLAATALVGLLTLAPLSRHPAWWVRV
ncbi:MAG: hypothetical protein R3E68_16965 [Burkholderiaceae bacterium]